MRITNKHGHGLYWTGSKAKEIRAAKPARERRRPEIDTEALAAALADLDKKAAAQRVLTTGNVLPATGHCHTCDRKVSGERRYCGPCLARRV